MVVDLTRKEPKLNTMYPITIHDSEQSIACRINFKIIDFLYLSMTRKHKEHKKARNDDLYNFLDIAESYYEALRNGKKIEKIKQHRDFQHVQTNELITGDGSRGQIKLQINGVSTKQWKKYFWICKKYSKLRKMGADQKYVNEARRRKQQFEKCVLEKIENLEMNEATCSIYSDLWKCLYENEESKKYRNRGVTISKSLQKIKGSDLQVVWEVDKDRFNEIKSKVDALHEQMEKIEKQHQKS